MIRAPPPAGPRPLTVTLLPAPLCRADAMRIRRVAPAFEVVPYDVPRECAAAYFPEANVVVPLDATARESNQPVSKMVPIRIARAAAQAPQRPAQKS